MCLYNLYIFLYLVQCLDSDWISMYFLCRYFCHMMLKNRWTKIIVLCYYTWGFDPIRLSPICSFVSQFHKIMSTAYRILRNFGLSCHYIPGFLGHIVAIYLPDIWLRRLAAARPYLFGPPKGRSYEFGAVSKLVSQLVSDAIPGNLVQEFFWNLAWR